MENLESVPETSSVVRSDLSDWAGAPEVTQVDAGMALRLKSDNVDVDELDYTLRLYDGLMETGETFSGNGYLPIGPANMVSKMFNPLACFKNATPLIQALDLYLGLIYDSIDCTFTLSNPKGLAGAAIIGSFPFFDWMNASSLADLMSKMTSTFENKLALFSGPDAHLFTFSEAKDVTLRIPWTFQQPFITRDFLRTVFGATGSILPGMPMIFFETISARSVSSVSNTTQLRMFYKFNGLRFVCPAILATPTRTVGIQKQSGLEVAGAAMIGLAIDTVASASAEIFASAGMAAGIDIGMPEASKDGTFEQPTAVQMAYVGDSTSVGPPPTTPIFSRIADHTMAKYSVLEYLKRPFFIGTTDTSQGSNIMYASPTFITDYYSSKAVPSWLRFFAMMNTYWRGTIIYDFVILGHPMVETGYDFKISYPNSSAVLVDTLSGASILRGVCNGVYRIEVPLPFASQSDYLPVMDSLFLTNNTEATSFVPSQVSCVFEVVNTMLDVSPVIDVAIFVRAGEDFRFFQPFAPGNNMTVSSGLKARNKNKIEKQSSDGLSFKDIFANGSDFEKQLQECYERAITGTMHEVELEDVPPLPEKSEPNGLIEKQVLLPEVDITFETRARALVDLQCFPTCDNVEDYMKMWSRSIPFDTYDPEPVPSLEVGLTSACWWSANATAYTSGVQNSWYVTNDYLSYLSSLFIFYRGSIGVKIVIKNNAEKGYKYVTLVPAPSARQPTHTPFTSDPVALDVDANFGNGTVVSPSDLQPILDLTIPYRDLNAWRATNVISNYTRTPLPSGCNPVYGAAIKHNIVLQITDGDLEDALYRKAGADFELAVPTLMPPPTLWMSRGYDWG
jgi:hypothetical protein